MFAMQTTVNVPADRRVTLTLPPETPLGPLTLTVTADHSNGAIDEADRRNPDTPEFRAFVDRSSGLVYDLRDWSRSVQESAIADGRDPPVTADLLQPTAENRRAFRLWREERYQRAFPE